MIEYVRRGGPKIQNRTENSLRSLLWEFLEIVSDVFFGPRIFIIISASLLFRCAAVIEPLLLEEFGFQRR